ncbi:MAG: hypothetical protein AABZ12_00075 [Planctomycetota bacterium]
MSASKRRTYLTLIGVGLVALLVDRFILPASVTGAEALPGNSAGSSANPAPTVLQPQSRVPPVGTTSGSPAGLAMGVPEIPFPRGAERFAIHGVFPDLFARPTDRAGEAAGDSLGSAKTPDRPGYLEFETRHRVSAVISNDDGLRIAVIDGSRVGAGGLLDACTLVAITGREVRFRCHDGEAVLVVGEGPKNTKP